MAFLASPSSMVSRPNKSAEDSPLTIDEAFIAFMDPRPDGDRLGLSMLSRRMKGLFAIVGILEAREGYWVSGCRRAT